MRAICKSRYIFILISLTFVETNLENIEHPGPEYDCSYCQPEQIHIAFGEKINDIVVTWTTIDDAQESRVQFGMFTGTMDKEAQGNHISYPHIRRQWIHRVTLNDLQFNTTYEYRCGSRFAWSELFYFTTLPEAESMVRAAIYGDMGVENAHSLPYLQQEAENKNIDFVLHIGDFAYNMDQEDSRRGDQFMRQVQPFAAIVPYMVCPGNHENDKNFTQFKGRMSMPSFEESESMFYSWDVGPIHFVSINTEAYYFLNFGHDPLVNQFHWLVKDLEQANSQENRTKRPWIIMYGHRPMYCSVSDDKNCLSEKTRIGVDIQGFNDDFAIEPLLMKYGVDVVIWAHKHVYERTWPIYDYKVYNASTEYPYVNPRAPVHIITGSAGCQEKTYHFGGRYKFVEFLKATEVNKWVPLSFSQIITSMTGLVACRVELQFTHFWVWWNVSEKPDWSAFRSRDYGYTRFHAYNKTHVYFEQISVDLRGKVIDSFWIVQEHHGRFCLLNLTC